MKFGEYLRERRRTLGWTQPEAASKVSIEQSYLSKLETGKAYPSDDMFQRLIAAYDLDTSDVLQALSPAEADRLDGIDTVRQARLTQNGKTMTASRQWLLSGVSALFVGGALLGLTRLGPAQSDVQFTYQSTGIILPGESMDVFGNLDATLDLDAIDAAEKTAKRNALIARVDDQTQLIKTFKGPSFVENLDDGKRVWRLVGGTEVKTKNRYGWANVPGFMLILGGLGCFFVSWRWPQSSKR